VTGPAPSSCDVPAAARARSGSGRILLLAVLAFLLVSAFVLQVLPYPETPVVRRDLPLPAYLPSDVAGWHGEDRPLAGTEALADAVKSTLDYDEAILRCYRKGSQEFTVYIAYWQPGKTASRDVAFHIPDKCWVSVGWKRAAADYDFRRALDGRPLAPAQYREFEQAGELQHVIYWHIFNGRAIVYNPDGSPSDLSMVTDLLRRGLRQKGEQYFIRIASSTPLDELWTDPGFRRVLEAVAPLGPGLHAVVDRFQGTR